MLVKTRGIVLGFIKYKETSVIVNIYTEALGLKSYVVNGVRDKKSKAIFFQPLTLLDLVVYDNNSKGLNRISEYTIHRHYTSSLFNPKKIAVILFLAEILSKTLKEEHPEEEMFCFIVNWLSNFDEALDSYEDFHILFLIEYAEYLGIKPSCAEDFEKDFGRKIDKEVAKILDQILVIDHVNSFSLGLNAECRRLMLTALTEYYEHHFPFMGRIQSLGILKEVFN
jgi:DNA repair protein RecO (recombination protein O)